MLIHVGQEGPGNYMEPCRVVQNLRFNISVLRTSEIVDVF